ncbi:MAG: M48 family metallopeptidase [Bacteroidales bacterium]|nr:M48 family metallopeptidase [Bacteroidales bacterium]MBQ4475404.1 M48 family metallopeptidase [Bacteroidales bacterium]
MLPDNCSVTRRNVKNARLRVCEDGSVQLFVPMAFTDEDIERLLEKKSQWIASKRQFFEQKSKIQLRRNELLLFGNRYAYFYSSKYKNKVLINHESRTIQAKRDLLDISVQEKWIKTIARKYISSRARILSEALLLPYNKLYIRSQKRKWGNCSKEKNISINWRVIKAPEFVIDYIIIHELCHTVIMKHTVRFQTLLRSHCPDCEQAQAWLDKYGNSL